MGLNATSLAAGIGVGVRNVQFKSEAVNLPRKILVIGSYDPSKTSVVANVPVQVLSPEDAGSQFGFGFMIHRLVKQVFTGSNGVECWVLPQAEAGGAVAATGSVDFTGSTGVLAGTIYLYVANLLVTVPIAAGSTASAIATAVIAAINAASDLPVTAVVNGSVPAKVDITSKSKGVFGNSMSLDFNLNSGQSLPSGVTAAVIDPTGSSGTPVMATSLAALGTGDNANEAFFTDVVHGYGLDTTTIDAISAYVGAGNDFLGLYSKTVGRPFRCLTGDTTAGSAGLTALRVITDSRLTDRANGIISVPGSLSHPAEIAAQAIGHMARINNDRVAQHYIGVQLIGIHPGAKSDRWTADYDSRDSAVKAGISPTRVQNGTVVMQNVVTFYRPTNVPVGSNGYRSMRNISIIQNMLMNVRLNFEQEKWQGVSIVSDTTKVTNMTDRLKARDISAVRDDLIAVAKSFESKAWIYTAAFTIAKLSEAGAISIRTGGLGFDNILSVILSGEGAILDTEIQFDTSLAILTT